MRSSGPNGCHPVAPGRMAERGHTICIQLQGLQRFAERGLRVGTAHIESGQARSSVAHRRDSGACVRLLDGFEVREGRYVFDLPANTSRHGDPRSPRRTAAPRLRRRRLVAGHCGRAGRCTLALGVVEAPSLGTHLVQASRGRLTQDSHARVDLCELPAVARRVLEPTHELQGGELEIRSGLDAITVADA